MKTNFGSGRFFGINGVSNPTPARFFIPQDVSVTIKRESKSLFGESQFAAAVAAGNAEVSGKVTMGRPNARVLADFIAGVTPSTGMIKQADKEAGAVPASSTYIVTVTNSATWTVDLGVIATLTGLPMTRVASGPTAGQYSVSAGVYTFAAADASLAVKISYLYTVTGSGGETVTMTNQPQGKTGQFTGVFVLPWGAQQDVLVLNSCIGTNTEFSTKQSDFGKPSFDFIAGVDDSDVLGSFSFAEAA